MDGLPAMAGKVEALLVWLTTSHSHRMVDATVRAHRAAAAAAVKSEILGLEATFERDFSLGYCSSAQGEHRLAH